MASVLPVPHPDVGALRVSGRSMLPTLDVGDVVLFHRQPTQINPGAVVVFHDCIHRVVWVEPRAAVWELGDANAQWPLRRAWSEIEGVVFARIREGEWSAIPAMNTPDLVRRTARVISRGVWSRIRASVQRIRRR